MKCQPNAQWRTSSRRIRRSARLATGLVALSTISRNQSNAYSSRPHTSAAMICSTLVPGSSAILRTPWLPIALVKSACTGAGT